MRIAVVTECFLPHMNGVTNSVLRILADLERRGHELLLVAPGAGPAHHGRAHVEWVPSMEMPVTSSVAFGLPNRRIVRALRDFEPEVVHLAAPVVLGANALSAARRLDLPTVAVFQTDLAGFARSYGGTLLGPALWSWLRSVHRRADLTLAPSRPVVEELRRRRFDRVALWPRGVDQALFHPSRRSDARRAELARPGEVVVGYVGRLAPEKRVQLLGALGGLPNVRLVVVGDGPSRPALERKLPGARFVGFRSGTDLAELYASLDVFVHTGKAETFCQAIQEAQASGVPVVAPAAGGPLDLVRPGVNGYLFAPDDVDGMRRAVATLAADAGLRERMGASAHRSVASRSWEAIGDLLVSHYEAVAGYRRAIRSAA